MGTLGSSCKCEPIRHLQGMFWDDRHKFTIHIYSRDAQRNVTATTRHSRFGGPGQAHGRRPWPARPGGCRQQPGGSPRQPDGGRGRHGHSTGVSVSAEPGRGALPAVCLATAGGKLAAKTSAGTHWYSVMATCLTVTCDLFGNGKYGGQTDIYQSWEHGARPTRNLCPPCGDHPAAQRARPSLLTRSRTR
jgi:hypothetical protein